MGGYLYNNIPLISMLWMVQYINIFDFIHIYINDWLHFDLLHYLIHGFDIISYNFVDLWYEEIYRGIENSIFLNILWNPLTEGMLYGISLGVKSCIMIFVFIWVRASFPRIRFDQLMSFCWIILLPIVIAFIILIPCILYSFAIIPTNISLF